MSAVSRTYTFTDGTDAFGSQVENEFNTIYNAWNNHDSGTSIWTSLKAALLTMSGNIVMASNKVTGLAAASTAGDALRYEQLIPNVTAYRRPTLQWSNVTTVAVESGLDGTSGNIPILFPDGNLRTETSTTRTTFVITRNAVLTSSGGQSGLRTSLSEATNTWYSLYAVKCTDDTSKWMTVGDTVTPTQANFATLNSNFGTSGWVYLGLIANGDNASSTGDIARFWQVGNYTQFENANVSTVSTPNGLRLASTAGATTLTYTYASGTAIGSGQIPTHVLIGTVTVEQSSSTVWLITNAASTFNTLTMQGISGPGLIHVPIILQDGILNSPSGSTSQQITLRAFYDGVLGVGPNPFL